MNPGMYQNLYKILRKALGEGHRLVQKMKAKIDDFMSPKITNKDKTVVDFPDRGLDDADPGRIATTELDIERADSEQIKDVFNDIEKIIDYGPQKFKQLPIDQQGNAFRNFKRFERKTLMAPDEGIASLQKPQAPVFKIQGGEKLTGQGLESLQKKLGLPSDSPGPRKSKMDQGILNLKRNFADVESSAAELGQEVEQAAKVQDDIFSAGRLRDLQSQAELRGVARQLIIEDIQAGKLKNLSPGMKKGMLEPTGSGLDGDPLDVLFRYYGPDASEVLDMLVKKHGATPDGIDLIKLDLKNKVGIQPDFEFKPRDVPMSTLGGREGKIPLTQNEVVEFLTGVDKEGNPIPMEKLKFYNDNFDFEDYSADTQYYLKRFLTQEDQKPYLKNLPSNINVKGIFEQKDKPNFTVEELESLKFKPEPEKFAMGGRVGYQVGGAATPEQFAEGNPFQKDLLVSMYGAPGAGKSYYAESGSVGIPYLLGE